MPLDPTVGGPSSDTYASLAEFETYAESRLPQVSWFLTATDPQKESALIAATRMLDGYLIWTGLAASSTQSLSWPRKGMFNRNGFAIAENAIPIDLKNAQSELALQLGGTDLLSDNEAEKKNVKRVKAGSVEVEFQSTNVSSTDLIDANIQRISPEMLWTKLPDAVRSLLVPSWYVRQSIIAPVKYGDALVRVM